MSNIKHTPGPWSHGDILKATTLAAHKRIYMPGAIAAGVWSMGASAEEVEATATLIAAAPELLAALIDAVGDDDSLQNPWRVAARAAIAKATGSN